MIESLNLIINTFFNLLKTWFNATIYISDGTTISIRTIIIFLWLLWISLQIIHTITHVHSDKGETYNSGRD